jgi:hypothetical protein
MSLCPDPQPPNKLMNFAPQLSHCVTAHFFPQNMTKGPVSTNPLRRTSGRDSRMCNRSARWCKGSRLRLRRWRDPGAAVSILDCWSRWAWLGGAALFFRRQKAGWWRRVGVGTWSSWSYYGLSPSVWERPWGRSRWCRWDGWGWYAKSFPRKGW